VGHCGASAPSVADVVRLIEAQGTRRLSERSGRGVRVVAVTGPLEKPRSAASTWAASHGRRGPQGAGRRPQCRLLRRIDGRRRRSRHSRRIETALKTGKSVVTANKALIAKARPASGPRPPKKHGGALNFEGPRSAPRSRSSRPLREGPGRHQRQPASTAILNGTCNYILTRDGAGGPVVRRMFEGRPSVSAMPRPIRRLTSMATTPRRKLAILARPRLRKIKGGRKSAVYVEGISSITPRRPPRRRGTRLPRQAARGCRAHRQGHRAAGCIRPWCRKIILDRPGDGASPMR